MPSLVSIVCSDAMAPAARVAAKVSLFIFKSDLVVLFYDNFRARTLFKSSGGATSFS